MAGATHIFPLFSEHVQHATAPSAGTVSTAAAAAGREAGSAALGRGRSARAAYQQQQQPHRQQDVAEVQSAVAEVVAGVLGAAVEPTQPLMEAGLDSIGVRPPCSAAFGNRVAMEGLMTHIVARRPVKPEGIGIRSSHSLGCTELPLVLSQQHAQVYKGILQSWCRCCGAAHQPRHALRHRAPSHRHLRLPNCRHSRRLPGRYRERHGFLFMSKHPCRLRLPAL